MFEQQNQVVFSQKSGAKGSFDMALLVKQAASLQLHVFCTQQAELRLTIKIILLCNFKCTNEIKLQQNYVHQFMHNANRKGFASKRKVVIN